MKNNFWKGLIMTIIALIASYISENVETGLQWQYILITTIGTTLVYVGKNAVISSDSPQWVLNLKDLLSALVIGIGTAISSGVASFIIEGGIDWKALGTAVIAVVVGYFSKTFATNSGKITNK